jgi:peptidoglycan/xylan/chitin deacetylase (PgdA/CDA1 family)
MSADVARATVCVSLDFDATSLWFMLGSTGARSLSRGEFGADTAAPRLLELFERLSIPSTWFIPGHTADHFSEVCAEVARAGHEIGHHGYLHEDFGSLSIAEGVRRIEMGIEALVRVTGREPRGMRFPGGDLDGALFEVLPELGFTYDSSLFGEYLPRWARGKDQIGENGRVRLGPALDLVELPVTFIMSDFVNFEIVLAPPFPAAIADPRQLEQVWRDQFDYMYEHVPGGYVMLMLHPQSIGWGSRIAMLERFLEYCGEQPGTHFATAEEIADGFRAANAEVTEQGAREGVS